MQSRLFAFVGGNSGAWRVTRSDCRVGDPLAHVSHLHLCPAANLGDVESPIWVLRGITSNERYITAKEKEQLVAVQEGLSRPHATHAAFLPIRKNAVWWALSQDDRRAIFGGALQPCQLG